MNQRLRASIDMTLAMILVGSSVVVGKIVTLALPTFFASALRYGIAALVLVPLLLLREGGLPRLSLRDHGIVFIQALTGSFLFSLCLLFGVQLTSATSAGLITSATPAVVGLLGWLLLRERLTGTMLLGIGVTLGGIAAINSVGASEQSGSQPLVGNALILGAVVGEALFTILRKLVAARVSPLASATAMSVWSTFLFLPGALWEAPAVDLAAVPLGVWASLLYYALGITVLGFVLWFRGVAHVPAGTAAIFTGVWPVSAVILAAMILGEPLTWLHAIGMLGVLSGIVLIARVPQPTERAAEALT